MTSRGLFVFSPTTEERVWLFSIAFPLIGLSTEGTYTKKTVMPMTGLDVLSEGVITVGQGDGLFPASRVFFAVSSFGTSLGEGVVS